MQLCVRKNDTSQGGKCTAPVAAGMKSQKTSPSPRDSCVLCVTEIRDGGGKDQERGRKDQDTHSEHGADPNYEEPEQGPLPLAATCQRDKLFTQVCITSISMAAIIGYFKCNFL